MPKTSVLLFLRLLFLFLLICFRFAAGVEMLYKSKLQRCEKKASASEILNCTRKIVLNLAVPSGSNGGEASIIAEVFVEVEEDDDSENSTESRGKALRIPPVVTINKSVAYALYELTYIQDVAYKPQEYYVHKRKCEPDAGVNIVKICERMLNVMLLSIRSQYAAALVGLSYAFLHLVETFVCTSNMIFR